MQEYTREQLTKLYKELPNELKDWITSDDSNDAIYNVLKENNVLDKRCEQISILCRNVLFGLLPMENFHETIKKDVGLEEDLAKKISQGINRFVFFPIKSILNDLYRVEKTDGNVQLESTQKEIPEQKKPAKSDSYLEHIEQ